jgi:hypothetical protein
MHLMFTSQIALTGGEVLRSGSVTPQCQFIWTAYTSSVENDMLRGVLPLSTGQLSERSLRQLFCLGLST